MISNIITYLFIGTCWILLLDIIAYFLNSEHNLSPTEKIVTSLIWPITLITFVYHFVKTFFSDPN